MPAPTTSRWAPGPTHAKLSAEAKAPGVDLGLESLQAEEVLSEALEALGLPRLSAIPPAAAGEGEDPRVVIAVALQINYQLKLAELGGGAFSSETRGDQATVIARDPRSGRASAVDPSALALVRGIIRFLVAPPDAAPARPPQNFVQSTTIIPVW
jgi:hypothetical protein